MDSSHPPGYRTWRARHARSGRVARIAPFPVARDGRGRRCSCYGRLYRGSKLQASASAHGARISRRRQRRGFERPAIRSATRAGQQVFPDAELQALIRTALTNNYDLRIAAQHVLEQTAQVKIVRAQQFPQISVGGTGIGAELPASLGTPIGSPLAFGSFSLSGSLGAGFLGTLSPADGSGTRPIAGANLGAAGGALSIVQQVATTYIELRALDRQLEIARETLKTRQESVDLTSTPRAWRRRSAIGSAPGRGAALHRDHPDPAARTEHPAAGECAAPAAR